MSNQGKTINSVSTALQILETIRSKRLAGVTEIADELGLPKSTVQIHMNTLRESGYIVKRSGKYQIGARLVSLGQGAKNRQPEFRQIEKEVQQLAAETGEQAHFVVIENGSAIVMYCEWGDNAVKTGRDGFIGECHHAHAAGKAVVAFLPEAEREAVIESLEFEELTENTITDEEEFRAEMDEVREQGYAFNREEHIIGQVSVGVPLVSSDRVIGGLSISGPSHRLQGDRLEEELPKKLLSIANQFEVNTASVAFDHP